MLSRRNIRIKVMQLLYAATRDAEVSLNDLVRRYESYGRKTIELYLLALHQLVEVARYAERDEISRRAKLRPSEEDKAFKPKLAQNELIQGLLNNEEYKKLLSKHIISARVDDDNTRAFYNEFAKTVAYKNYVADDNAEHLPILLELFRFLNSNENFKEFLEDHFTSWLDDESLIVGAVKKTLKSLPSTKELVGSYGEEDLSTIQFGEDLLIQTTKKDDFLLEEIKPMLKNWEADRVALLDMILIKMATAEFVGFPSIPTKVTLNEYVDLSKAYSTDKSKDFVNGLLDKMMKKLKEEGKINKEGRGLVE
jgi:transcription antitermination protein NusB